ncbi:MAG TPA: hypothetical protein VKU90_12375 [Caulobacteraceae bacterium]|nr:hypothetical protein [Caulobacteraceae bacterium]
MSETFTLAQAVALARSAAANAQAAADAVFAHRRALAAELLAAGDGEQALASRLGGMLALTQQQLPWEPTPEDERLSREIHDRWASAAPNVVMAAMALAPAHHFPILERLAIAPQWLRGAYARYLLGMPALFAHIGEGARFGAHAIEAMARLHAAIFDERLRDAVDLATAVHNGNCEMVYFNDLPLKPYFRKRAEIVEWLMRLGGAELNWTFPPREAAASPRVGVLCRSLQPGTETFYLISHLEESAFARANVTLYVGDDAETPLSQTFRASVAQVVRLPAEPAPAVARVRADDLDLVLIANNVTYGPSREASIAAHRLARVQVTGAASPVTSGWSNADLFLSGESNDPDPDAGRDFEERLVRLPGSVGYFGFAHDHDPQTIAVTAAQLGIAPGEVVLFSAANFYKLTPEVVDAWIEILVRAPATRLFLMPFNPNWGDAYAAGLFLRRLDRACAAAGLERARIQLIGRVPTRADLMALMALAHVYLDSFPFPGSCSLVDPLLVGLPIVAHGGERFRTAIAASMLPREGVGEAVCADREAYVARALRLATDPAFREAEAALARAASARGLVCLQPNVLNGKFADFCTDAVAEHRRNRAALEALPADALRARAAQAAAAAAQHPSPNLRLLGDAALTAQLIAPYLAATGGRAVALDLGAGTGGFSAPLFGIGPVAGLDAAVAGADLVVAVGGSGGLAALTAAMRAKGYDGLRLLYRSAAPEGTQALIRVAFDDVEDSGATRVTALFHKADDRTFLIALVRLLEANLPATDRPL